MVKGKEADIMITSKDNAWNLEFGNDVCKLKYLDDMNKILTSNSAKYGFGWNLGKAMEMFKKLRDIQYTHTVGEMPKDSYISEKELKAKKPDTPQYIITNF